jgi:tetratricopeptide (TPR) repeat protein
MPETAPQTLDPKFMKMVENARYAMERDNPAYAIELCMAVLGQRPGALQVRKLLRAAQLKQFKGKNRFVAKTLGAVVGAAAVAAGSAALKKDPVKAMEQAEKALSIDPSNIAANKLLAQAATTLGFHDTAAFAWESVRDAAPDNRENLLQLGRSLVAADRHADAVAIAEKLLRKNPMDGDAQELMKHASVAQSIDKGNWDSATGSYRDKLRDEQTAVSLEQANKVVASTEMTQRLLEEAKARATAEPENLNHYRSVIQAYQQLGDLDSAVVWVLKARETAAGSGDATLAKLEAELREAALEKRVAAQEAAVAASGEPEAEARLAALRRELHEHRLAGARALVERYPNDMEARYRLGTLLYEADAIDDAISQFQTSQRSPKVRVASLLGLGACFQAKGLFDLAVLQYETAKSEVTAMDDTKKNLIYQLGLCYEQMGQPEKAIGEFKQIYAVDIGYRDVSDRINAFYASKK